MAPGEYGSNDFDEGSYKKYHFRDIMENIMKNEDIRSRDQFIKHLVKLDLEDFIFFKMMMFKLDLYYLE